MTENTEPHQDAYKPDGYPDLSPYLVVADAQATLDFIQAVFGNEPIRTFRNDDGTIIHAEARVGDSVVMVGQAPGGAEALLHVYVPDPDESFRLAIAAGGSEIEPVEEKDDGNRRGAVRDPNGTRWYFARGAE